MDELQSLPSATGIEATLFLDAFALRDRGAGNLELLTSCIGSRDPLPLGTYAM